MWMLLTAGFVAAYGQPLLALVPFMGFTVGVSVAVLLWNRRDRILPFTALQYLLRVLSVAYAGNGFAITYLASPRTLNAMGWPQTSLTAVSISLFVPALLAVFTVMERGAKSTES